MMSLYGIRQTNAEKEKEAIENNIEPISVFTNNKVESISVFNDSKVDIEKIRNMPHIGDHRPSEYELIKEYFVDSSGLGGTNEPALTFGQFINEVKPNRYYAIIESGQFQVYIGEFKRL